MPNRLAPVPLIAAMTRQFQALQPQRPLRGLSRFANLLNRVLPSFAGEIRLTDGTYLAVDSRQGAERWLMYSGNYQPALTYMLKQHTQPGDFCLDIGANLGFYSVKFGKWVLPGGKVAAFEANPVMAKRVAENLALNNFSHASVIQKAVHSQSGNVTFFIHPSPGKSSIDPQHVPHPVEQITVQAITIDEFIVRENWERLDVIKLDIEGADCYALLGAQNSLGRFRPFMVFEYWYNTPSTISDTVFSMLSSLNYNLQTLSSGGKLLPFNRHDSEEGHVDVICVPPDHNPVPKT